MSYILDALRKAERERPRQTGTRFRIAPVEQAHRWWRWAIAGALLANALLLSILSRPVWWPPRSPETGHAGSIPPATTLEPAPEEPSTSQPRVPPAAESRVTAAQPAPRARTPANPDPPAPAARVLRDPAVHGGVQAERVRPFAGESSARSSASTGAGIAAPRVVREMPTGTPGRIAPARSAPDPAPAAEAARPGLRAVTETTAPVEVPASTASPAPAAAEQDAQATTEPVQPVPAADTAPAAAPPRGKGVTLDVLVYSETPAERLVFINGRKYVEGQRTDQGMVVEAITPQGAMLSHQGRRFLLEAAGSQ